MRERVKLLGMLWNRTGFTPVFKLSDGSLDITLDFNLTYPGKTSIAPKQVYRKDGKYVQVSSYIS
jgi:hypothetical protein